jgi:hypothetical protein
MEAVVGAGRAGGAGGQNRSKFRPRATNQRREQRDLWQGGGLGPRDKLKKATTG